jgi:hypothetical protein
MRPVRVRPGARKGVRMSSTGKEALTDFEARVVVNILRLVMNDPDFFQEGLFNGHEVRAMQRAVRKLKSDAA